MESNLEIQPVGWGWIWGFPPKGGTQVQPPRSNLGVWGRRRMSDLALHERILSDLQAREGGIIRSGKLYPIAPALSEIDEPDEIEGLDPNIGWFAVYTEVRAEFRVEEGLREAKFQTFLPTLTRYIKHARTVRERKYALFPRYVFVGFNPKVQCWGPIEMVEGVARLLQVDEQPLRIPDRLITKIMVDDLLKVNVESIIAATPSEEQSIRKKVSKHKKSWKGRKERRRAREQRRKTREMSSWLQVGLAKSVRM